MTTRKKNFLLTALTLSALTVNLPLASAASSGGGQSEPLEEYSLDEIVVTATRTEKRDVDVPMSTEVITRAEIERSGAQNASQIIQKVNGVSFASFAPLGASMGTMMNKATIRGIDNGTLVMVNGNPVASRGLYNLQEIPADSIEKVEIVKGGGSVLYGSEAMAGVINIITKKGPDNNWTLGFGNYGQQTYHVNVGAREGDQSITAHYDVNKWNRHNDASKSDMSSIIPINDGKSLGVQKFNVRDIKNESLGLTWQANSRLNVTYDHHESKASYDKYIESLTALGVASPSKLKAGELIYDRQYTTIRDTVQVNYRDKAWEGSAYYNVSTIESDGDTWRKDEINKKKKVYTDLKKTYERYNTKEKHITYGFDGQHEWKLGDKGSLIVGVSGRHEVYRVLPTVYTKTGREYERNQWGVFGQWEQTIDEKNKFILGARETWTSGTTWNKNYSDFSASGQFIHSLDKDSNLYLNISQSFIMPQFGQMFPSSATGTSNPNLKPQKGINYEIGWKNVSGGHTWKAALFHQEVKDNISAQVNRSGGLSWTYKNEDFRNTGFEFSCDITGKNGFSYNYGLTLQNPEVKSTGKGYWDRKFGKIQLVGGVNYQRDKMKAALTFSYLADRVQAPSNEHSFQTKPYLLTTLTLGYSPDAWSEISLKVDNLLNRHDNTMHSSSAWYTPGINYLLSYTQKF
ncbi:MAG: TonB-dependent receptor plug domain-containing protein [Schwartzia sp. (in: firmicutes)]